MTNKTRPLRYYLNLFLALIFQLFLAFLFLTAYYADQWTQSMLHPTRVTSTGRSLFAAHIPYQNIKLTTADGLELAAWYTPPKNGVLILVAHGYDNSRPEDIYLLLAAQGYGVLAWDFRAHGESDGSISTLGYNEQLDVEAALNFALAQNGVEHVGAWGGSMGAATIILTAAKHPEIEAVVADSAFPTLEDVLKVNIPSQFLLPFAMASGKYHSGVDVKDVRPVDEVGKISPRAVFIIDGWKGEAVTMNSPYRLYAAANEPKKIWVENGVPHLGMLANDPEKYKNQILEFFDEWLLEK
jgi:fermentation-respiration switch protein FrsA (DUF1100 family)